MITCSADRDRSSERSDAPRQQRRRWAAHAESVRWTCPECATELPLYDHAEERTGRHLDSCQFQTYLHARPPRVTVEPWGPASPAAVGGAASPVHDVV